MAFSLDYSKNPKLPSNLLNYSNPSNIPDHFAAFEKKYQGKVKNEIATLGRVLFYDKTLSLNNSISCSSCHLQEFAFADSSQLSLGLNNTPTNRNAPSLFNLFYAGSFFWDLRERDLEAMVLHPIQHPGEMGISDLKNLESKLSATPYYPNLFKNAFGDKNIDQHKIAIALKQFLFSMISANSKFDEAAPFIKINESFYINKKSKLPGFTPQEKSGFALFYGKAKCFNCHSGINLDGNDKGGSTNYEDIGLSNTSPNDLGMGEHFGQALNNSFKVPSLRNVELSAPYMHDGRFSSLEEVINFYNNDITSSKNLSWILRGEDKKPINLNLSEREVSDIIVFLKTLTDNSYIKDQRYSSPFEKQ